MPEPKLFPSLYLSWFGQMEEGFYSQKGEHNKNNTTLNAWY